MTRIIFPHLLSTEFVTNFIRISDLWLMYHTIIIPCSWLHMEYPGSQAAANTNISKTMMTIVCIHVVHRYFTIYFMHYQIV